MQTADHTKKRFREKLLAWFGLTSEPVIKVYHGYGHSNQLLLHGHVLKLSPLPVRNYRKGILHNTVSLLRMFMVKPYAGVTLQMVWEGKLLSATSDAMGFFKFEWKDQPPLPYGWNEVKVKGYDQGRQIGEATGTVYIPYETQYGFVSDIDDTFLVSHSSNLLKRLMVLFTKNARSRQPFDGSVKHYQLLAEGNTTPDKPNPFFFVSSSEWNLYDYIAEFARVQKIPRGIFLLNTLKQFGQLLKTGQNNHQTKFTRIVRIIETYPEQRFVLLGDSSQHDPYIYEALVKHFPKRIQAVYIRDVFAKNQQKAKDVLGKIEAAGVACCFFQHSSEAILHSAKIGLINSTTALQNTEAAHLSKA